MPPSRIKSVNAETRAAVASAGGSGRARALAPAQRSEIARSGAAKTNSPLNYAQRIRRAWNDMPRAERAAVSEVLSGCNGLFPKAPKAPAVKRAGKPAEPSP